MKTIIQLEIETNKEITQETINDIGKLLKYYFERKNDEHTTQHKHTSKKVRTDKGDKGEKNKTTTKGVKGDQPQIRLLQEPSGA
ncbi:MAG: hypothetical protein KDH96_01810 [Candidatus Riesia sp.]|nr:hypothetical protein [Candidatus Riesia sp.]